MLSRMPSRRSIPAFLAMALLSAAWPSGAEGAAQGTLAAAARMKCTFTLMSVGTWAGEEPAAEVKPASLVLEFEAINADEGTAQLESGFGVYDIIVRYAEGYLHFIQSFLNGPLYATTVLEEEAPGGGLKAMHSRHEHSDFALPGFTSSPEQYYGACEVLE